MVARKRLETILSWLPGTGYSRGNGGVIRLRLLPDDGTDAHVCSDLPIPVEGADVHQPGPGCVGYVGAVNTAVVTTVVEPELAKS